MPSFFCDGKSFNPLTRQRQMVYNIIYSFRYPITKGENTAMDDVGRTLLLVYVIIYIIITALMHILGLSLQTVTRSLDEELDERGLSPDRLRFGTLCTQIFCGAVAAFSLYLAFARLVNSLVRRLFPSGKPISACFAVDFGIMLLLMIVFIGAYAALCTEIPRRAAKTGSLSGERGERFAHRTFKYLRFMLGLFSPVIGIGRLITAMFSRIYSVRPESDDDNGEELIQLIGEENENGGIEDAEAEMISNIFEFTDLDLHEVMTHRTEICGVELSASVSEAVKLSVETGFSRIPVYRETIDDICGVLYIKDLLPLINEDNTSEHFVSEYLRKIKYVPESAGCDELFRWFTENKRQIAVVLDEYGGTAGIVTMEDLLECIVGNIRDEYDSDEEEEVQEITPNTFDILGSADPDETMERLGCPLEEEHDFDTMGGFVTSLLGYIPENGRTPSVRYRDITFNVISARDNRIERIRALIDKKRVTADEEK